MTAGDKMTLKGELSAIKAKAQASMGAVAAITGGIVLPVAGPGGGTADASALANLVGNALRQQNSAVEDLCKYLDKVIDKI